MYGNAEFSGKFKGNTMLGGQAGPTTVKFSDGQAITYHYPSFKMGGMLVGKRDINWEGDMTFDDPANGFNSILTFGAKKKKNLFRKQVGKLDDVTGDLKIGDVVVGSAQGSWLSNLVVEDTEYWNIDREYPSWVILSKTPLPSDWRFREDLVYLTKGNQELAQRWKWRIEE